MQSVGIICELNPLHAGHAHLLERARSAETVICLMSGNFVQRGEAAVLPPVSRAAMALAAGADLVLELPFPYACGSARYFATAGVRVLQALGCDTLLFGSECADVEVLRTAAARSLDPEVIAAAATRSPEIGDAAAHFAALGDTPASNDILAIEYLRAILAEGAAMQPIAIPRVGDGYRATHVGTAYPSATALRRLLHEGADVTPYMPQAAGEIFCKALARYGIADTARLAPALLALLRGALPDDAVADAGGGLLAHLAKAAHHATDYDTLCAHAATKRYTDGRLRRVMLYALAGVKQEDLAAPPAYVRLLAANKAGRAYLAKHRKVGAIPVVTKMADIAALGACAERQRMLSARADGLYAQCMKEPTAPAALAAIAPYLV